LSRHLPSLKPREILRVLSSAGFAVHHISGSHYILKQEGRPGRRVTLPWHGRDLKRKTLVSIIDQAGMTVEEFLKLV
jgi:predicted RNA binding protein YcfA (HicA-like mRNA interferase family)